MQQLGVFATLPDAKITQRENKAVINKLTKKKKALLRAEDKKNQSIASIEDSMLRYESLLKAQRPNVTYELITTYERLDAYLSKILDNQIVAIDTETTGLNPLLNEVVGISLYTPGENPVYISCGHNNYEHNLDLKPFLTSITDASYNGLKTIWANGKFDIRNIRNTFNMDRYIWIHWDCILAAKFLNENEKSYGLKNLWNKYIQGDPNAQVQSYKQLFGSLTFDVFNPEKIFYYPAMDGLETFEVYEFQKPFLTSGTPECTSQDLEGAAWLYNEIEIPLSFYLASTEDLGVNIDRPFLQKLDEEYTEQLDDSILEFDSQVKQFSDRINLLAQTDPVKFKKIGNPVNPGSAAQLSIIIYDVLGMNNKAGTGKGTGADIIEELMGMYPQHKNFFEALLTYRKVSKLLSTYVRAIPQKQMNPNTLRVHSTFNQYGAATGRFSSKDPNLQNIPSRGIHKQIRKAFIPTDGYYFVGSDYSQQEPRCLAELAGDASMMNAYVEGKDLYAEMASTLYKVPYEECLEFDSEGNLNPGEYKQRRTNTKSILLGIMYGRGANSIAAQMGISKTEAVKVIEEFKKEFPKVSEFEELQKKKCKRFGYVKTAWGRKRRLPDLGLPRFGITGTITPENHARIVHVLDNIWNMNERKLASKELEVAYNVKIKDNGGFIAQADRQTVNSIIQGSAADMTKIAMVRLYENEELRKLGGRVLMCVHDEVICEAPKEVANQCMEIVVQVMKDAAAEKLKVPMKCDGEITDKWGGKDLTDEVIS